MHRRVVCVLVAIVEKKKGAPSAIDAQSTRSIIWR